MKKNYISPNVDIYEVKVNQFMCSSPSIEVGSAIEVVGDAENPVNFGREFDLEEGNEFDDFEDFED